MRSQNGINLNNDNFTQIYGSNKPKKPVLRKKTFHQIIIICAVITAMVIIMTGLVFSAEKDNRNITMKPEPSFSEAPQEQTEDKNEFSITYDFGFTTETLEGQGLRSLLNIYPDGNYTVNEQKCAEYIDFFADTYDTFGKDRKFHATIQGDIIVPHSSDAVYGWETDRQKSCEELVKMLEEGKTVESCEPVYYDNGYGYVYTGVRAARTAEDDIGDSYVEIDLTAQHLWVYKNGEIAYQCDIVSGQSTSMATITLPGVYKLWYTGQNYPLSGSNADGESWSTTCNYWNLVSVCGIGLHDTVSRSAFGGNIFQYDGSKGCINMQLESAEYIYNEVELGTPVVMYYSEEQYRAFGLKN